MALVLIAAITVLAVWSHYKNYNEAYDSTDTRIVNISVQPGSSSNIIAKLLQSNGIIKDAETFRLKARLNKLDSKFQAGDYSLSPSMTMEEIMTALQDGHKDTTRFTIPEGYNLRQVAAKLKEDGLITNEQDFYDALEDDYDYWFVPEKPTQADPTGTLSARANRLEGFLFPETYEIYVGATPHQIINKMLSGFDDVFGAEWKERISYVQGNVSKKVGSVADIVNVAALIERETRLSEERPVVASVIYNRLNINMKLQLDASIQYVLGEQKDRVLYSDLEIDSLYNTYKYEGLPAGPIASPGKASLEAALYPEGTEYYYYVLKADGSGGHNFARNSNDFAKYKEEYINSL